MSCTRCCTGNTAVKNWQLFTTALWAGWIRFYLVRCMTIGTRASPCQRSSYSKRDVGVEGKASDLMYDTVMISHFTRMGRSDNATSCTLLYLNMMNRCVYYTLIDAVVYWLSMIVLIYLSSPRDNIRLLWVTVQNVQKDKRLLPKILRYLLYPEEFLKVHFLCV